MSGPTGVATVLLLETAVGGSIVLWASGVWGAVRRGFFLLAGATVALCAVGAWAVARPELAAGLVPGAGAARLGLGVFGALAVLWQVLLLAGRARASKVVGLGTAVAGVGALVAFAPVRGTDPWLAFAELALGSVFLGSAVFGLLLGHWYLVERRLSNVYMIRGAWWYVAGVAAAVGAAALAARNPAPSSGGGFSPLLAVPGFSTLLAGGLVAVCALIAGFVWKLAKEGGRSIQAATGMFYLAVIMALSAEMATKFRFFS